MRKIFSNENKHDSLRDQKFWGISLLQWLSLMVIASAGLLLILRYFFG